LRPASKFAKLLDADAALFFRHFQNRLGILLFHCTKRHAAGL
jgi:hypothetical protein